MQQDDGEWAPENEDHEPIPPPSRVLRRRIQTDFRETHEYEDAAQTAMDDKTTRENTNPTQTLCAKCSWPISGSPDRRSSVSIAHPNESNDGMVLHAGQLCFACTDPDMPPVTQCPVCSHRFTKQQNLYKIVIRQKTSRKPNSANSGSGRSVKRLAHRHGTPYTRPTVIQPD